MAVIIHKYKLAVADEQFVAMPIEAKILSAQVQHGEICLWVLCDDQQKQLSRRIYMLGTGHDASDVALRPFIGTVQLQDGALIFHLFDGGEWGVKA